MTDLAPSRYFVTRSGLKLAADEAGPDDGPVVLLMHGGGQTRHSWGGALASLAETGFHAFALDTRGHGDSDWAPDGSYALDTLVDDVVDVITALDRPVALVGASLGGLVSLHVVGREGVEVTAVVLVDVVPRVETEGAGEIIAFMEADLGGFASIEDAAQTVAAYLPHRKRPPSPEGLRKNLRFRDGRYYWHWDPRMLDARRRGPGQNRERHLEAATALADIPTLLVHGGRSRVVSAEGVEEFRAILPHARYVRLSDADHMVAGDANDAFSAPLTDFLINAVPLRTHS